MRSVQTISTSADCDAIESQVVAAASRTVDSLKQLLNSNDSLKAFAKLKFETSGFHPTQDRPLNLFEQVNQIFTYLASLRAAKWLLQRHRETGPFRLNLGTDKGSDIESLDGTVAAETFASVSLKNNGKLKDDIAKVGATNAVHKYVFYICPSHPVTDPTSIQHDAPIKIVSLGW